MSREKVQSHPTTSRPAKVIVRFDQQQRKLLDFLRADGKLGKEDGEIIRNVVLDYIEQQAVVPRPKAKGRGKR